MLLLLYKILGLLQPSWAHTTRGLLSSTLVRGYFCKLALLDIPHLNYLSALAVEVNYFQPNSNYLRPPLFYPNLGDLSIKLS
jgi:hypothetical protein